MYESLNTIHIAKVVMLDIKYPIMYVSMLLL